jgi:hypothetical protein
VTCKGAAELAWSLAPKINLKKNIVGFPYRQIFQYTGSALLEVGLTRPEEYPMILRHLTDNCLRLRSLSLSDTLLSIFTSMQSRLAGLLPRLSQLRITADRLTEEGTTADVNLPFIKLSELFNMVGGPLKITYFRLCSEFRTPDGFDVSHFLSKLPQLRRLAAPITPDDLLTVCKFSMLEEVTRVVVKWNHGTQHPRAYFALASPAGTVQTFRECQV